MTIPPKIKANTLFGNSLVVTGSYNKNKYNCINPKALVGFVS